MTARRASILVATAALALSATPASPQRSPGYRVAVTAGVRTGDAPVTAAILIGSAGQIYRPDGAGSWRRTALGGVSADLVGAIDDAGVLYGFGRATPLFRYDAGSWHVHPLPNRGPIGFATSGAPAIAIGRHVYLLSRHEFTRVTSLPAAHRRGRDRRSLTAVWASDARRIYAAGSDGKLGRYDGKRWTNLPQPLPASDRITSLTGVAGKQLIAIAASGTLLEVGARRARPLTIAPELTGFRAVLACPDLAPAAGGAIWVVGTLPADPAPTAGPGAPAAPTDAGPPVAPARRWILTRAKGGRLERVDDLPAPAGDRFTVLIGDPAGGLLLATRSGRVLVRGTDRAWTEGRVSGEPPPLATRAPSGRPGRSH